MNGTGDYFINSVNSIYPNSVINFDVTNDHTLGWDNHFMFGFKGEIGYRFSERIATNFSFDYYLTKDGYRPYLITESFGPDRYPSANFEDEEHISSFDRKTLRLTGQFYINKSIFLIAGLEYIIMDMNMLQYYFEDQPIFLHTSDNCTGIVIGLGMERYLSNRFSLVGSTLYSFAKYDGDKLMYGSAVEDFSFDVGGLEMGLGLRYYWR